MGSILVGVVDNKDVSCNSLAVCCIVDLHFSDHFGCDAGLSSVTAKLRDSISQWCPFVLADLP